MGLKLNTPESLAAADAALRQKIRNELILNKPPQGVMAGLYKKIPTNIRLLAENIVGVDRPITNKDFTNDELVEMAFLAQRQREANAEKERFLRQQQQFDVYPEQKAITKKRLQSFEDTKGKTSVNPYDRVGDERLERGRKVDKGYFDSIKSSFTDPRYGVATTLGKYNVRETPEMDVIEDTYNFNRADRNLPSNPILALQRMAITPEVAGEYLANALGTEDRQVRIELEKKPKYPVNFSEGGGIMGAFSAPPASTEMFKRLADKTDMFGPTPLGAVNRAIVGTPIDVLDYAGRVGETVLRGAATGAGELAETLGMGEGMADRLKRDVYGLGIAASTLAPMAGTRPRGKSNKALVLEAQKDKVKSPVAKQKLDEDLEMEAINNALKDVYLDLDDTLSFQSVDDIAITTEEFGDVFSNNFAMARDAGKNRGESVVDAIKMTQDDFNVVIDRPIQDKIFARLDDDYGFGANRAVKRREEAAANKAALDTQLARASTKPIRTVSLEEATRMQNEISGMGIPQPTPQKPRLAVIEGGKD